MSKQTTKSRLRAGASPRALAAPSTASEKQDARRPAKPTDQPVPVAGKDRRRSRSSSQSAAIVHQRQGDRGDRGNESDDDGGAPIPKPANPLALMLGKRDLAALLNVNVWTIDRWRKSNPDFPAPIWITGTSPRWPRKDVTRWLASRPRGGRAPDFERTPQPPMPSSTAALTKQKPEQVAATGTPVPAKKSDSEIAQRWQAEAPAAGDGGAER